MAAFNLFRTSSFVTQVQWVQAQLLSGLEAAIEKLVNIPELNPAIDGIFIVIRLLLLLLITLSCIHAYRQKLGKA